MRFNHTALRSFALFVALACATGCPLPRESALRVIDELDQASANSEKAHQDFIHDLLVQSFSQLNTRLEAERGAREAQAEVEMFRMTEKRNLELAQQSVGQLTAALGPALTQMRTQLEQEKEKLRTGQGGSRARELELASQYSSTIAVSTHEAEKMRDDIDNQLKKAREDAITELRSKVKGLETPVDPEKEATALLQKLIDQAGNDGYLKAMKRGFDELRSYVKTDSPATLFLQGLLGQKLGSQLGSMLDTKASQLETKYIGKIESSIGDLQKKYSSTLTAKK